MALSVLHHKPVDLGAYMPGPDCVMLLLDLANGTRGVQEMLIAIHGETVPPPLQSEWRPEGALLDWHGRGAVRGKARHRG